MRGFEFRPLTARIYRLTVSRSSKARVTLKSQKTLTILLRIRKNLRVKQLADFVATHFCL